MGGLLQLVQRVGDWAGCGTVPNVTAHPSTASVPITVLLYNGPLLCGFNVAFKGLITVATALSINESALCIVLQANCIDM